MEPSSPNATQAPSWSPSVERGVSLELIDFRGKITAETNAWLESESRTTGRAKQEILSDAVHEIALAKLRQQTTGSAEFDALHYALRAETQTLRCIAHALNAAADGGPEVETATCSVALTVAIDRLDDLANRFDSWQISQMRAPWAK